MLLKENDPALYVENHLIFDSMKSPAFHLQHQAINMSKARKVYGRKQVYKLKYEELFAKLQDQEEELKTAHSEVMKLQQSAATSAQEFSDSVARLSASQQNGQEEHNTLKNTLIELELIRSKLVDSERLLGESKNALDVKSAEFHNLDKESSKLLHVSEMKATNEQMALKSELQELKLLLNDGNRQTSEAGAKTELLQKQIVNLERDNIELSRAKDEAVASAVKNAGEAESGEKVALLQKDLDASDEMLNQAQKRIIILETQLEKEEGTRKKTEEKLKVLKSVSRPGTAPSGEELSKLSADEQKVMDEIHKQFHQEDEGLKFKPESEYSSELAAEREAAARKLQGRYRLKMAYDTWFRVKLELTAKAGVMMALSGTAQGFTGFYLNPSSSSVFYYRVTEAGEWVSEFDHMDEKDYKNICERLRKVAKGKGDGIGSMVPIAAKDWVVGNEGWYCGQDMKCVEYVMGEGENGLVPKKSV